MSDKDRPDRYHYWCTVHRTREDPLNTTCAYCHRGMHIHESNIKLAKRGIAQVILCGRCAKPNRLVVAFDGARWELMVQENGNPVLQGTLRLKTR
jgi:hypothetical protein